jgi:hypothetical protein
VTSLLAISAMYNWAAVEIPGHLAAAKLLKLSVLLFLDVMLPSSKALIPPHLQTPTRLNSAICQGIPLQSDQLLYTTLCSQEPPVPEDP